MKGFPKYKYLDKVKFNFNDEIKQGEIYIVDKYGTFDYPDDASYDIFVKDENTLYKHISESFVEQV